MEVRHNLLLQNGGCPTLRSEQQRPSRVVRSLSANNVFASRAPPQTSSTQKLSPQKELPQPPSPQPPSPQPPSPQPPTARHRGALSVSEPVTRIYANPYVESKQMYKILFYDDVAGLLPRSRTFASEIAALRFLYDFVVRHSSEDSPASMYHVRDVMCAYFAKHHLKLVLQACSLSEAIKK